MSFPSFLNIGLVGIAGAIGALARYLIGRFFTEHVTAQFPLGTLVINVSGAFCIGIIAGLVGHKALSTYIQLIVATGFLGGYTTFSTMQWEGVQLFRARSTSWGMFYFLSAYALGILAAALGLIIGGWM